MLRRISLILAAVVCAFVFVQCGGSDGSDGTTTAVEGLFPTDLAVASPTAVAGRGTRAASVKEKLEKLDTLVKGDASLATCVDLDINWDLFSTNANCYGPAIEYTNHPHDNSDGNLPGGDFGMFDANEGATSEACLAAQLDARVGNISGQVDTALYIVAAIRCIMAANGKEEPGVGSSTSVTALVNTAMSSLDLTVTDATLAQSEDGDGNLVNLWTFTASEDRDKKSISIRLKHVDTEAGYKGKLSYKVSVNDTSKPGNCAPGGEDGFTYAGSIGYEKSSSTSLTYKLHSGQFCGDTADPFVSSTNYTVDGSKSFSRVATGWGNNFNVGLFNMNPATLAGNYQFAWQAGPNDAATRAMNVTLSVSRDTISGCGYFGYGPQVSSSSVGSISGMYCNWAGPGGKVAVPGLAITTKAQKQCITRDASDDSAVFTASSSAISYAPANDCNDADGDNTATEFTFKKTGGSIVAGPVTNNLVNQSEIATTVTTPTAPADVDA